MRKERTVRLWGDITVRKERTSCDVGVWQHLEGDIDPGSL